MNRLTSVGVLPRTAYDFSELRNGAVYVPIAQGIDVEGAPSLSLEVRVHEATIGTGSAVTLRVAADSSSMDTVDPPILQTKTAKGEDIAAFVIDSKTVTPLYQIVRISADEIGACLAMILEARGGVEGGPKLSLSIDLLLRGGREDHEPAAAGLVEPIITRPEQGERISEAALSRVATAARGATMSRPRRYARWREIVV